MRSVGEGERMRALQSSINQAVVKSQPVDQLDGFCVQMSIRIYWMEKAFISGVIAPVMVLEKDEINEQELAARAATTWFKEWQLPICLMLGVIIVGIITGWIRRAREKFYFTEYEIAPRMSGSHAAGVNDAPQEMYGKLMSISDTLMERYYLLLLGEARDPEAHPMEAKKALAQKLTARYHDEAAALAAREDWDLRFSKKNLADADLPEISISTLPAELTVLTLSAHAFSAAFSIEKSNSELRKQFITTGSVQLNGEKLTDPNAVPTLAAGDVLKLSKKHAVRLID
jgi:hypothetical protein